MELSDAFLSLGEDTFRELLRGVSIGKLRTYQLYESFRTRAHMTKVNVENLRKAAPRLWTRMAERDEDFARDLAQAVLLPHLEMIKAVLEFLQIPNTDGFFAKDLDASKYLTAGWQQRVWEKFQAGYPAPALRLYINHLAWELDKAASVFAPAA